MFRQTSNALHSATLSEEILTFKYISFHIVFINLLYVYVELLDFRHLNIFFFLVFLPFLGPLPWHMEVSGLGVESEL